MQKMRMIALCLFAVSIVYGEVVTNKLYDINVFFQAGILTNKCLRTKIKADYYTWLENFRNAASVQEKNQFIERWLSEAYAIKPAVCTNGTDKFSIVKYGDFFNVIRSTMSYLPEARTNDMFRMPMARYIGSIELLPYQRQTKKNRLNIYKEFRSKEEEAKWRAWYLDFCRKQDLDNLVEFQNKDIQELRWRLFSICSLSVQRCRDVMSNEAFTSFTNNFVIESHATEKEQKTLFERL